MPPTLITININEIKSFRDKYDKIIIKHLYVHVGADVFSSHHNDKNLKSIIEYFHIFNVD